jgi:hypothetical protein
MPERAPAMIFIDNKYTKWYYAIIDNARQRVNSNDDYLENHHIIPDCFFVNRSRQGPKGWLPGNPEDPANKIKLTAEEHFICHHLLTKMVSGKPKYQMLQAATAFVKWASQNHSRNIKLNAKTYARLKKQKSQALAELWKNDTAYRKAALAGWNKLCNDLVHKSKMSNLRKDLWKDTDYLSKMSNRLRSYKKVSINGITYDSLIDAGKALGITSNCVSKRCSNPKLTDWNYL